MRKVFLTIGLVWAIVTADAQTYHYDVNKDGLVSIIDVTFLVNNILGVANVGEDGQNFVYDVNGDGVVNVMDLTRLVNKILGTPNPGEVPNSYLDCPDDHHPHFIDLGLPSGTLWACCNVDADKPEDYGGFYAWGETEEKDYYDWSTYAYCEGSSETCLDLGDDISGTPYDVAHVKWGGYWVMPSREQQVELFNNCTSEWTTVNGVSGSRFRGPNGSSIFLPAAGSHLGGDLHDAGSGGGYWSSTPKRISWGCALGFGSDNADNYDIGRCLGLTVRPVYK